MIFQYHFKFQNLTMLIYYGYLVSNGDNSSLKLTDLIRISRNVFNVEFQQNDFKVYVIVYHNI